MAIRVFEIAKEYSRSPDEIMKILSSSGIRVSSLTAELDEHALHTLTAKIGKYRLTVVDGGQEAQVSHSEMPAAAKESNQKKKKGEDKAAPHARLAVRVIKKAEHAESAEGHDGQESDDQGDDKSAAAKPRPKLRKPVTRRDAIEERITKISQRVSGPDDQEESSPAKETHAQESAPAAPVQAEAPSAADSDGDRNRQTKRAENPSTLEIGSKAPPERDRRPRDPRDNRDNRDNRGPRDNRDRPGFDNRGGGRPGEQRNFDNRGGDQRPDNRGGDQRPDNRGDNRPVEARTDARPADTRPADQRPADTRPADQRPADTRPAETRGENRPSDQRPYDNRGGDNRPPQNRDNRPRDNFQNRDGRPPFQRDRPPQGRDTYQNNDARPMAPQQRDGEAPRGPGYQRPDGPPQNREFRDNRDTRGPGSFQNRDNRPQGGPGGPAGGGGYQNRDNRPQGGPGGPGGPGGGGYQNRDNRPQGGPGGPGGYQNRDNRPQGGPGGPGGGGYQNRDNRPQGGPGGPGGPGGGGGYQGRGPGGPGGPGGGSGYQGRGPGGPGGPGGGGGYQGRGPGGPGGPGGGGGYQGRGPGGPGGPGGGGFNRGPGGPGGGFNRGPGGPPNKDGGDFERPRGGGGGGGGGFNRGPGGPGGAGGASPFNAIGGGLGKETSQRPRFGTAKPGAKKKKKKRRGDEEQIDKIKVVTTSRVELPNEDLGIIMLSEGATVKELAEKVNRMAKDVIKRLFEKGIMATLNHVLDPELAIEIAKDFGYLAEIVSFEEDLQIKEDEVLDADPSEDGALESRAPIVTIMGHVDHGKTTLLDAIRKAKVASGEAGGITQHIGAYSVSYHNKRIVFLDTPGHEAFTKMRARGASVTDIVILVVAADDGVKPQTVEAINHAKAAKVPIITCINKIDKPGANPERVKQMLTEHELVVEEFGGDSPCCQVSAKMNIGLDDLLEMILLVADVNDLKASPLRRAKGTVIEAKLDRGRGPVATVVVQDGTLKVGDYFITGQTYGKIRAMHDDLGKNVLLAPPSTPVEILGVQEVPAAGDVFQVVEDEISARKIASFRKEKAREDSLHRQKHTSLDQLFNNLKQSEIKDLAVIIKADVQGSIEGLVFALNKIKSEKVNLRIVHQGVGSITENDVLLAVASDAIIIGFNTKSERKAQELADNEGIDVRNYSVIYDVVNQIEAAMLGLVAPTFVEREIGRAVVRQLFSVAKLGKVAGCFVEEGVAKRSAQVRVMRMGNEIFKGTIQTLKRFKDDVNEVKTSYECGVGIKDFADLEENDTLHFFVMDEVQATQL